VKARVAAVEAYMAAVEVVVGVELVLALMVMLVQLITRQQVGLKELSTVTSKSCR
jgi:hypothetical protein